MKLTVLAAPAPTLAPPRRGPLLGVLPIRRALLLASGVSRLPSPWVSLDPCRLVYRPCSQVYISSESRICKKGLRCQEVGLEVDTSAACWFQTWRRGLRASWDWARLPRRCSFPKLPPFLPVGHPHRLRFALLPLAPGAEMFRVLLSPASSQS